MPHATLNYSTRTSTVRVLYRLYLPVQYYRLYLRCNLHTTIDYTYGNDYGILLYASTVLPAVIVLVLVLQRRNALYAYPYFAGGIKATCEFSSKWSSENGQNASTNIPYYLRSYIEGFPCVPRNFRRFILLNGHRLIRIRRSSYEYCTCTKSHCTGTRPRIRIKSTAEFRRCSGTI